MERCNKEFFKMTRLIQVDTGLNYRIWILSQGNKKNDLSKIKVEINKQLISVSISKDPIILLKKRVTIPNFDKLKKFIILNYDVLIDYWNSKGEMSLREVFKRLKKVK